jgi:hypothetical protein
LVSRELHGHAAAVRRRDGCLLIDFNGHWRVPDQNSLGSSMTIIRTVCTMHRWYTKSLAENRFSVTRDRYG